MNQYHVHPKRARFGALIGIVAIIGSLLVLVARPTYAAGQPFIGANGTLVVEAEHADDVQARGGTDWRVSSSGSAAGGQALDATGSGYHGAGDGATATYPVAVDRSGIYYLWTRARATSSDHNSVFVGVDGRAARMHLSPSGDWTWNLYLTDNAGRATQYLGRGDHTLTLAVSEGGAQIDRILLTTDANYRPSGAGPVESTRRGQEPIEPIPLPPVPTRVPRPEPPPAAPVPAPTGAHPMGCQDGEIFQDSQDWWMHDNPARDFGHVHTQVCFPLNGRFTRPTPIKITSALHANPGTLYRVDVQVFGSGPRGDIGCNDTYAIQCRSFKRTLATCTQTGGMLTDNGATCKWTDTFVIDPNRIDGSGLQQFRFRSFVKEPDGTGMRTSTSLHATVVNNRPARTMYQDHGGHDYLRGRGWYTDAQYASAYVEDASRLLNPISGMWTPRVHFEPGENFDGTPPQRMSGYFVGLDSDFHHDRPGTVVAQGSGEFHGTVRIDTTKLSNGWHRLFLKGEQRMPDGHTNAGVLATYFLVKN